MFYGIQVWTILSYEKEMDSNVFSVRFGIVMEVARLERQYKFLKDVV